MDERQRNGHRSRYMINALLPLPDPIAHEQMNVGGLLETLTAAQGSELQGSERLADGTGTSG
jgi:hypothetical protein